MYILLLGMTKTTNTHHPFFNNHSPSRFQQKSCPYGSPYKTPVVDSDPKSTVATTRMNPPLKYQYQYQAPPTPSKLGNSTPSHNTGSGSHGTSSLLASLDKSILQIRYCLFALVQSWKLMLNLLSNYYNYKWVMSLIFVYYVQGIGWLYWKRCKKMKRLIFLISNTFVTCWTDKG